jgi:hypothetical protein
VLATAGVAGTKSYDSRTTGTRRRTSFGFVGALYGATLGRTGGSCNVGACSFGYHATGTPSCGRSATGGDTRNASTVGATYMTPTLSIPIAASQ